MAREDSIVVIRALGSGLNFSADLRLDKIAKPKVLNKRFDNQYWLRVAMKVNKYCENSDGVCTYGFGSRNPEYSLSFKKENNGC